MKMLMIMMHLKHYMKHINSCGILLDRFDQYDGFDQFDDFHLLRYSASLDRIFQTSEILQSPITKHMKKYSI